MIKYFRLPFRFDAGLLQRDLDQLAGRNWPAHYQKFHYEGDWSALPLRSIGGNADNIFISPENNPVYADTPLLAICPYFREVLSFFPCPLMAVRLLKLGPGAVIKEHRDAELCFEKGEIRLHIPVVTNEQVEFFLDQERIRLQEGECWYMNFNLPHSILNKSETDRVHLVIDASVNDWVRELFSRSSPDKKEAEEPGMDEATRREVIARLRLMGTPTANKLADEMETGIS